MIEDFIGDATKRMDKSVEATHDHFNSVRTGRATPALLDRITIDYYGTPTPLKNLATINAPEPRMLTIQPFDPSSIKQIEKTIQESDLGLTPSNDGKVIRLPIPQLTEERRKELVKVVRSMAEEGKVAVRNVRRDAIKHLEDLVKNREVGDDEERSAEGARAEADGRAHVADRRAAQAQGSRDHGGLGPPTSLRLLSRIRTLARIKPLPDVDLPEVAQSVAIILDGNGRWAKKRRLPTAAGHRAGARTVRRIVEASIDVGIHDLAVFAFSTENWSRSEEEVDALMEIFAETIERELPDLAEQGVRVRFIGRRDRAPEALRRRMESDGGPHRAEHAPQPLGRVRLRRPGRARRGDAAARGERRGRAARSTRTSSPPTCTRPSCPTRTC